MYIRRNNLALVLQFLVKTANPELHLCITPCMALFPTRLPGNFYTETLILHGTMLFHNDFLWCFFLPKSWRNIYTGILSLHPVMFTLVTLWFIYVLSPFRWSSAVPHSAHDLSGDFCFCYTTAWEFRYYNYFYLAPYSQFTFNARKNNLTKYFRARKLVKPWKTKPARCNKCCVIINVSYHQ